jgi:murein DD-endopeptidase MepM/ murein hydrolase activator NlpD
VKVFLLLILLLAIATPAGLFVVSSQSIIAFDPAPKVVGAGTQVAVRLENPHGFRRIAAGVEQGGARQVLINEQTAADRWGFWRKKLAPRRITLRMPALQEGAARIFVEVEANDLRAASSALVIDVEVITQPPKLAVDSFQHYVNQGGSELVRFTVAGVWSEAGVRVGKYIFRSYPVPGADRRERFALFAYPWDVPADTEPLVYARNAAREATARFWHKVFPKKFRERDLEISEPFIRKVTDELDPGGAGDLLARFLRVNGAMRHRNNESLAALRLKTQERFLWTEPFIQLANSKVESVFADHRSYIYNGAKVDRQVHFGFDLSVTKNVAVAAANAGRVVHAAPMGIYGNCVVVDHGYGLQSIYAHLSEIGVREGDTVKKGQPMGKSGSTGLAGGDHLHFSMQIDGVQVNPVEWWDGHWIDDHIRGRIEIR